MQLAAILVPILAAAVGIGIYFLVKSMRAKKGARPPVQPPPVQPSILSAQPPPAQPPTPPVQPPTPPAQPPKLKPLEFAPYIPAKPKAPPAMPPPPPPSRPPPQPKKMKKDEKPRVDCPKGKVPDPDNPSKLCKPSCRGGSLGYPYWGPSGSCCASISNADCISWAQISKISDDKIAAEAERKRKIAEAEAERKRKIAEAEAERKRKIAEAEKKRLAAIEAEKKRLATIEAEKKRLAAIEAEKKRLAAIEAEKKYFATKYFLGTAFEPLARHLASNPPAWRAVRDRVGWWNHGMGQEAAKAGGFEKQYINAFSVKQMMMESSMSLTDGYLFKFPFSQVENAVKLDPAFRCVGFFPFFENDTLLNGADLLLARYKQTFAAFDRSPFKTKNFLFFAPPSKPDLLPKMMQPFRGHSSMTDWLYAQSGASGIAIDFPWRYRDEPKSLACAKQMYAETRKRGGLFVWVFDGSGRADDNLDAARKFKSLGIEPDAWVVDQFNKYTDYAQWKQATYYGPEECVKIITALIAANI